MGLSTFFKSPIGIAIIVVFAIVVIVGVVLAAVYLPERFEQPSGAIIPVNRGKLSGIFYGENSPEEKIFMKAVRSRKLRNKFDIVVHTYDTPVMMDGGTKIVLPLVVFEQIAAKREVYVLSAAPVTVDFPPELITVTPFSEENIIAWVEKIRPNLASLPRRK